MVDGFRNVDGMAVDAKYVNKPNQPCYRSLEDLRKNHATGDRDFLYDRDCQELRKYAAALNDPRNKEICGVETITNNQDSVPYWRIMMAAYASKATPATSPDHRHLHAQEVPLWNRKRSRNCVPCSFSPLLTDTAGG
ncbi:restriction endonuclease fold toxin-2 domain-containing protein [Streptomyces sp. NRAIS4]